MASFPFFRFPYPNYYYRYNPYYSPRVQSFDAQHPNLQKTENKIDNETKPNENINNTRKISPKYNSFANFNFSNLFSSNLEDPILEILGITLYFDDILILGLLFFLYTEGVKDEFLFICLILLLLG